MNTEKSLIEKVFAGEPAPRTPVWAMRQAGRWDEEFRKLRAGHDFYAFSENVGLATAASLCPRRFGVDAIILFYDITTLSIAMGQSFQLVPKKGPVPDRPVRTMADVQRLSPAPRPESFRHILDLLASVRRELADELPVLCFAGAPYTLATYHIGTGKDVAATRQFIAEKPEVFSALLDRITAATVVFLNELMSRGAAAFQLFDSWAGPLTDAEYRDLAHARHRDVFTAVDGNSLLFVKDCPHTGLMAASGASGLSLSLGHDLAALARQHPDLVLQGNVDHELLIDGTTEQVAAATRACLDAGAGARHILNLDHGMDKNAKPENFAAFVETATGSAGRN